MKNIIKITAILLFVFISSCVRKNHNDTNNNSIKITYEINDTINPNKYDISGKIYLNKGISLYSKDALLEFIKTNLEKNSDLLKIYNEKINNGYKIFKIKDLDGNDIEFPINDITKDLKIFGYWEKVLRVKFNMNGGSYYHTGQIHNDFFTQEIFYGEKIDSLDYPKPTYCDHKFVGWTLKLDSSLFDLDTPITKDITLIAEWVSTNEYIVLFEGLKNYYSSVIHNEKLNKPSNIPTRTGYTFVEWQLNGVKYNFNTPVTKDLFLSPLWKKKEYTVTFNTDGASTNIPSQQVLYEGKVTEPSPPTKEGYKFLYWEYQSYNKEFYFDNYYITSNTTLVAVWKNTTYTISFDTGEGGSTVDDQILKEGNYVITTPPNPVKENMVFNGWIYNSSTTRSIYTRLEDIKDIPGDITLYADWKDLWETKNVGDGVSITRYNGKDKELIIPAVINGKKVYGIDGSASKSILNTKGNLKNDDIIKLDLSKATNLTYLGYCSFYQCFNLETIVFSNNIENIILRAFLNCRKLKTLVFNEGLIKIEPQSFEGCTSLTTVELPNSLEEIGEGAFSSCSLLNSVKVKRNIQGDLTVLGGFGFTFSGTFTVHYPAGSNYPTEWTSELLGEDAIVTFEPY